jgi:hypothetical protein
MKKRQVYLFNIHFDAAEYYLGLSKDKNQSEEINSTSCLIFAAFGIEAFLNHVGEQLFSSWKNHLKKALSTEAKLYLIAEKIGLKVDFGEQPFQAFRTLFRFRNAMAHSVTEDLSDENAKHYLKLGNKSWPAAEWEGLRTSKIAEKISNDVIAIKDAINQKIRKKLKIKPIPEQIFSEFMEI